MRALVDFSTDPIVAEARVALNTCLFCKDLGLHNIILEGDAKMVVEAVNKMEENFITNGHLVKDIKLFTKDQAAWKIQYIKRDSNQVAHLLAKDALLINSVSSSSKGSRAAQTMGSRLNRYI